ncbi:MAG: sigma-70 family RNA polymerase sigma factor [Terracoccus sp.]
MTTGGEDGWRHEAPHVLAALLRRSGDFGACEDAVQEALLAAAVQWPRDGAPDKPRAWLVRVASRRLIDARRRDDAEAARLDRVTAQSRLHEATAPSAEEVASTPGGDDTLAMLLLCAHPALTETSRVALTLRAVSGLSTRQIAALLFAPEATVAQRISRAKATIRDAGLGGTDSPAAELATRLHAVRYVLYLTFTAGYAAATGPDLMDVELATEAIWMTEQLRRAVPDDTETAGLLALMLLTHARAEARTDAHGDLVPLPQQDRSRWDLELVRRGVALVEAALPRGEVGPFQLQAAIAAVHAGARRAEETDWLQITMLYRMLDRIAPSPTVTLNLAVAVGMAHGPEAGIAALQPLLDDPAQRTNHRLYAAHAHLLERAGRHGPASEIFTRAAELATSTPEQRYLNAKAAAARTASS